MGKNKRRQLEAFDSVHKVTISADSNEEIDTLNWLCEAYDLSIINDFQYQPPSFNLFDDVKYIDVYGKSKTLFRGHIYTPDWLVTFTPSCQLELAKEFRVPQSALSTECSVYIDSKGTFSSTERAFSYNQKWMWQNFKTYVYKLVPKKFFALFGLPEKSKLTEKTKKPRKIFEGFKLIKEVFKLK